MVEAFDTSWSSALFESMQLGSLQLGTFFERGCQTSYRACWGSASVGSLVRHRMGTRTVNLEINIA